MASLPHQTPSPVSGDDRNLVVVDENYLAPTFEDRVQLFWERHGRTVITALVVLVLFFAAKALFGVYASYRENAVRTAYAEAGDDASALRAFATANPAAALAGFAWTQIGDKAYEAQDYRAAADAYAAAVPLIKNDPVGARARMGHAVSLLKAGDAGARPAFEVLANDTLYPASLRAEAAYHLAVIASEAGEGEAASRYLSLAISVDTSGLWAQRATRLTGRLPAASAEAAPVVGSSATSSDETPAVSFPGATK